MTDEMLDQFQLFFSDKNNVNMSSYKVDQKTGLPILYLKENKKALWNKYLELYPNGMKRSSFMARLQNGQFKYQEDLGGLCAICNEYGYDVFSNLLELVKTKIKNHNQQVSEIIFVFNILKLTYLQKSEVIFFSLLKNYILLANFDW
jgi:hypothetical protein